MSCSQITRGGVVGCPNKARKNHKACVGCKLCTVQSDPGVIASFVYFPTQYSIKDLGKMEIQKSPYSINMSIPWPT